jgi:hypothetical protein
MFSESLQSKKTQLRELSFMYSLDLITTSDERGV